MVDPITDPSMFKPGTPIRLVTDDGKAIDCVVERVDGATVTTHLPGAYATGGVVDKYFRWKPEGYEPEPDDLTRAQLAETDPMLRAVADSLDDWLHAHHGITSSHHNAGHFSTLLHEHGYRIVPNEPMPDLAAVMPAATD